MNDNPFSPRMALALVLFGAGVFVLLLWMVGAGMTSGSTNDGGGHVGGKGLNGYAATATYLEKRGYAVRRSRSEGALDDPGLLVLTPPQNAKGADLEKIVAKRRHAGPTLVITPKWMAAPAPQNAKGWKKGWVALSGAAPPNWPGFLDDVSVSIDPARGGWRAARLSGGFPHPSQVLSGKGPRLVPLVRGEDGRVLAAYVDDGYYPMLERMALGRSLAGPPDDEDTDIHPLVVVFEPDLLDNYGMARRENAQLAERLFAAAAGDSGKSVSFDLTLNGLGASPNLLTLAFTPPFLAATLCLLIAGIAAGWRAFLRFGPPRAGTRAIAFGKRALVANTAGLIRRSRRLHLMAAPYAGAARERLAGALALPRLADAEATESAIDRALAGRAAEAEPFSATAARLRAARRADDMVKAARDLHSLERTLTR